MSKEKSMKDAQETGKELDGVKDAEREGNSAANTGEGRVAPEQVWDEGRFAQFDLSMYPVHEHGDSDGANAEQDDVQRFTDAVNIAANRTKIVTTVS